MIGKLFLGGLTRRQVALGVVLGLAIGLTPGINLTTVILVALLLLMNTNVPLGIAAAVVGKVLCVLLAPVTFWLGYTLMHALGLIVLVRAMANTPVLALLGWDVYCLLGAIPLMIVLGVVATKLTGKLVGKSGITTKAAPVFHRGRLVAAAVLLGAGAVLGALLLGPLVNVGIKQGIAAANGAEVNVRSASLSPLRGRLTINGLQVTDPKRPTHNTVQADEIIADVSISALLTKRMEVDLVSSKQMVLDAKRSSRGEVYKDVEEAPEEEETTWDKFDPRTYREKIAQVAEKLEKLKDYLEKDDPAEQDDPVERRRRLTEQAKATGHLSLSAKDYLTKRPTWLIRLAEMQLDPAGPIPSFILKGENITSHPSLIRPDRMKLQVEADPEALREAVEEGAKKGLDALAKKLLPGEKDESEADTPAEDGEEKKGVFDKIFGK
jgi:uncharacterized protein (TIGR03546 family)